MGERVQLPWPMWRVQYQLLGGFRRLSAIVLVCAVVLVAGIFGLRRLGMPDPFTAVAGTALNFRTGIQVFLLILGGCQAVYRAMLRDHEGKMKESHRLTPMSNITVVLGYLFGSTLQISSLFVMFIRSAVQRSTVSPARIISRCSCGRAFRRSFTPGAMLSIRFWARASSSSVAAVITSARAV